MGVIFIAAAPLYWGSAAVGGRSFVDSAAAKITSVVRKPVSKKLILVGMCLVAGALGHMLLGGTSQSATRAAPAASRSDRDDAFQRAINEAYEQGYDDGKEGLEK